MDCSLKLIVCKYVKTEKIYYVSTMGLLQAYTIEVVQLQLYMPIVYANCICIVPICNWTTSIVYAWRRPMVEISHVFSVFNIFTYYELKATIHLPFMLRKTCLKRPTEIPRHETIQHWRAICMYIRSLCRLHPPPNTGEGFFRTNRCCIMAERLRP